MFRTRRSMLKLVGVAPFLAPAFESVLAAPTSPKKRLVILQRFNGAPAERWFPKNWSDFTGSCLEPLNDPKLKSRLVALKNMTNPLIGPRDSHTYGACSCWAARAEPGDAVSLDQYIADKANFPTPRKTLALGVYSQGIDSISTTFYKARGSPADISDDPYASIERVFSAFVPSGTGPDPVPVMLAKKKSILDLLKNDLGRLSKNLNGLEKEKLDAHLTFVRSAEMNLGNMMNMPPTQQSVCKKLEQPATKYGFHDLAKLPEIAQVNIELVAMAMACDISRVFVIQMLSSYTNVGGGDVDLTWCGANIAKDNQSGFRDASGSPVVTMHQYHHALTADARERNIFGNINTTYARIFGELMKKLDSIPDESGTLLDNSISVLGSEYGANVGDLTIHAHTNMPFLVGGGGGFIKGNQMLDVGGASHTQLHGTLLEYFGLDDGSGTNCKDFGDRGGGLSYASFSKLKAV